MDSLHKHGKTKRLDVGELPLTSEPAEDLGTAWPQLKVVNGVSAGRRFTIRQQVSRLGRGSDSDVSLGDSTISREHAIICRAGHRISVRDASSRNGTLVNGRRVKVCWLSDGDLLTLGDIQLVFMWPEERQARLLAEES